MTIISEVRDKSILFPLVKDNTMRRSSRNVSSLYATIDNSEKAVALQRPSPIPFCSSASYHGRIVSRRKSSEQFLKKSMKLSLDLKHERYRERNNYENGSARHFLNENRALSLEDYSRYISALRKKSGQESQRDPIALEHAYSLPRSSYADTLRVLPRKVLFPSKNPIVTQALNNNDGSVDVCEIPENLPLPYDDIKASQLMNECERHITNFSKFDQVKSEPGKPNDKCDTSEVDSDDWEAKVSKDGWTKEQSDLFNSISQILHSDHLSRLALTNVYSVSTVLRAQVDLTAAKFRQSMAHIMWDAKLVAWLHSLLFEHLSTSYLAAYLDILQTLKSKMPHLIDKMISVNNGRSSNVEALTLLLRRPWDPVLPLFNQHRPKKIETLPIIVQVPSGPASCIPQASRRIRFFNAQLQHLAKSIPVSINADTTDGLAILEQIIKEVRRRVVECKSQYPNKPIILLGWGIGAILACDLSIIEPVAANICLGFPTVGISGTCGEAGDRILDSRVPIFFVVGEKATDCCIEDLEDLRLRLRVRSGLVVIGGADSYLRIPRLKREREGLTQSMVDRCIVDEIGEFISVIKEANSSTVSPSLSIPSQSHHPAISSSVFIDPLPPKRGKKRKLSYSIDDVVTDNKAPKTTSRTQSDLKKDGKTLQESSFGFGATFNQEETLNLRSKDDYLINASADENNSTFSRISSQSPNLLLTSDASSKPLSQFQTLITSSKVVDEQVLSGAGRVTSSYSRLSDSPYLSQPRGRSRGRPKTRFGLGRGTLSSDVKEKPKSNYKANYNSSSSIEHYKHIITEKVTSTGPQLMEKQTLQSNSDCTSIFPAGGPLSAVPLKYDNEEKIKSTLNLGPVIIGGSSLAGSKGRIILSGSRLISQTFQGHKNGKMMLITSMDDKAAIHKAMESSIKDKHLITINKKKSFVEERSLKNEKDEATNIEPEKIITLSLDDIHYKMRNAMNSSKDQACANMVKSRVQGEDLFNEENEAVLTCSASSSCMTTATLSDAKKELDTPTKSTNCVTASIVSSLLPRMDSIVSANKNVYPVLSTSTVKIINKPVTFSKSVVSTPFHFMPLVPVSAVSKLKEFVCDNGQSRTSVNTDDSPVSSVFCPTVNLEGTCLSLSRAVPIYSSAFSSSSRAVTSLKDTLDVKVACGEHKLNNTSVKSVDVSSIVSKKQKIISISANAVAKSISEGIDSKPTKWVSVERDAIKNTKIESKEEGLPCTVVKTPEESNGKSVVLLVECSEMANALVFDNADKELSNGSDIASKEVYDIVNTVSKELDEHLCSNTRVSSDNVHKDSFVLNKDLRSIPTTVVQTSEAEANGVSSEMLNKTFEKDCKSCSSNGPKFIDVEKHDSESEVLSRTDKENVLSNQTKSRCESDVAHKNNVADEQQLVVKPSKKHVKLHQKSRLEKPETSIQTRSHTERRVRRLRTRTM